MIELARNPKGGPPDRRFRQTLMKSQSGPDRQVSSGSVEDQKERLLRTEQDNVVWKKMLDDVKPFSLLLIFCSFLLSFRELTNYLFWWNKWKKLESEYRLKKVNLDSVLFQKLLKCCFSKWLVKCKTKTNFRRRSVRWGVSRFCTDSRSKKERRTNSD